MASRERHQNHGMFLRDFSEFGMPVIESVSSAKRKKSRSLSSLRMLLDFRAANFVAPFSQRVLSVSVSMHLSFLMIETMIPIEYWNTSMKFVSDQQQMRYPIRYPFCSVIAASTKDPLACEHGRPCQCRHKSVRWDGGGRAETTTTDLSPQKE